MVKINVFGKQDCPKCHTTRNKLEHFVSRWKMERKVNVVFHDLDTVDGLAEGAFYDVNEVPLTIVECDGRSIARWDGEVPNSQAVRLVLEEGVNVPAD